MGLPKLATKLTTLRFLTPTRTTDPLKVSSKARIKGTLATEEFLLARQKIKRRMMNLLSSRAKRESEIPSLKTTTANLMTRRRTVHSPSLEDLKEDREVAWEEAETECAFSILITNDCVS